MKRTGKIFVSMTSLGVLLNNVAYATTEVVEESEGGLPTKYIFMGVAALVIVLLLFLGYKMDTKEDDTSSRVSHKAEKTKQKLSAKAEAFQQNEGEYEADDEVYEADDEIFDNSDLNDSMEYEDEDSLYSTSEDDEEIEEVYEDDEEDSSVGFSTAPVEEPMPIEETETDPEIDSDPEDVGEEFDTSIIDGLDDEEEPVETKNSFDETMLFSNSDFSATGNSLEDEIDNLENISNTEPEEAELIDLDSNEDKFIDELKNFEEPESNFEGFSVAPKAEEKVEEFTDMVEDEVVKPKKYTKAKKEENKIEEVEDVVEPAPMDNDFLSQMEANLQKSKEDRESKKETKTTKKSTKKKED